MKKRNIIFILLIFLFVAGFIFYFSEKDLDKICSDDSECIPSSCCHSQECVNKNFSQNCSGTYCTQECSGPLDCNAGRCSCIEKKCKVVKNE